MMGSSLKFSATISVIFPFWSRRNTRYISDTAKLFGIRFQKSGDQFLFARRDYNLSSCFYLHTRVRPCGIMLEISQLII